MIITYKTTAVSLQSLCHHLSESASVKSLLRTVTHRRKVHYILLRERFAEGPLHFTSLIDDVIFCTFDRYFINHLFIESQAFLCYLVHTAERLRIIGLLLIQWRHNFMPPDREH